MPILDFSKTKISLKLGDGSFNGKVDNLSIWEERRFQNKTLNNIKTLL